MSFPLFLISVNWEAVKLVGRSSGLMSTFVIQF
jgi:hypothetical protein